MQRIDDLIFDDAGNRIAAHIRGAWYEPGHTSRAGQIEWTVVAATKAAQFAALPKRRVVRIVTELEAAKEADRGKLP